MIANRDFSINHVHYGELCQEIYRNLKSIVAVVGYVVLFAQGLL